VGLKSQKSLNLTNGYPNKNKKNNNNKNNNNKVKSKPLELFELAGKKCDFLKMIFIVKCKFFRFWDFKIFFFNTLTCPNSAIFKATEIYQYETESSKHQDSNELEFRILVACLVWSKYAYFKETTEN
jgi:hypothetical protein